MEERCVTKEVEIDFFTGRLELLAKFYREIRNCGAVPANVQGDVEFFDEM
jgi:hypothetical protein